jgi:GNAT superfamily N-acetyltransferase
MVTFSRATFGDIQTLQQLAHTIWHSHYPGIISLEQIEYMLEMMYSANVIHNEITSGHNWILLKLEEQPIGLASYHLKKENERVKLNKLYLLPIYHGKGYGQKALKYIADCSRQLNAKILYLTVNKNNTKAINAYYRAGFYLESEVVNDIGNGYVMDDFVLAYKL